MGTILGFFMVPMAGWGQALQQSIRGRITDKQTLQALSGVSVHLEPGNRVVFTDSLGRFSFPKTTIGRYKIQCSLLGYAPFDIPFIELNSGKELLLPIEMEEKPNFLHRSIQHFLFFETLEI